jgi:predicted DNA-binding transcriptional regulator AlpA
VTEKLTEKTYLTSLETVAYLSLPSLNALQQRMKRRTIPAWCWTRMGGKSLRFVRASLDEWLQPSERIAALRKVQGRKPKR